MIYETVAATALQTAGKGIELIVTLEAEVPVMVRADPVRLRQVVLNLLGNAVKFTHEGHISIRVSNRAAMNERASLCIEGAFRNLVTLRDQHTRGYHEF